MANLIVITNILLFTSFFLNALAHEPATSSWFHVTSRSGGEVSAKIHLYVQDVLAGENQTVYEVARASVTSTSPTSFGQVRALDDLLTALPDPGSKKVGRIQGLITSADLAKTALAMNLNFYFTSGEIAGSTICMVGRNQIDDPTRELAVVGGTGVFRFARGYAITKLYSYDVETNHGVIEYTLYVRYSDESLGEWVIE
ncbi:disease resistance-responsive (dirigent-likeprotein) family protein [Striga asiatica]|uniref:Dirigent protein n=1 Tax=Striga asiatica TaxID=4170 RepID=A0A5A7QAF9_STRAF|nr:disease resistance-responsive (dirigent-likeprotein) family protein [Striga asiatica]